MPPLHHGEIGVHILAEPKVVAVDNLQAEVGRVTRNQIRGLHRCQRSVKQEHFTIVVATVVRSDRQAGWRVIHRLESVD